MGSATDIFIQGINLEYDATSVEAGIFRENYTIAPCVNRGPYYWHVLTFIPAWISSYIQYNVWDYITYPNFNGM